MSRCPDFPGQFMYIYDKASVGTITKCMDYAGVLLLSVLIIKFHCAYI